MSTTVEGIDARGMLIGWLHGVTGMYIADIKAIPDDKWTATHGGCTRPANELTADALTLLTWCTATLTGDTATADGCYGTMKELAAEVSTKEAAIAKFGSTTQAFAAAVAAASDETLNKTITPPWQMAAPLYMICNVAVSHIWYHDGQLNYIQCLLGDGDVHWMAE